MWDSPDLVSWSSPRYVVVAPPNAGMAWAPEAVCDEETGDFVVHFAAALYDEHDPDHEGECLARLLVTRTEDFHEFSPAQPYLELPGGVIDMTVAQADGQVHRFAKQDDAAPGSRQVFHQVGSSLHADDFVTLAQGLGQGFGAKVEGPLVFRSNSEERWYLWLDQYAEMPQGYHALSTTDLRSGRWEPVADADFDLPENTKHGAVLPLRRAEWERLDAL
ncbi:glycoside hydrolase family 43 protein [Oerskovia sp. M15]